MYFWLKLKMIDADFQSNLKVQFILQFDIIKTFIGANFQIFIWSPNQDIEGESLKKFQVVFFKRGFFKGSLIFSTLILYKKLLLKKYCIAKKMLRLRKFPLFDKFYFTHLIYSICKHYVENIDKSTCVVEKPTEQLL